MKELGEEGSGQREQQVQRLRGGKEFVLSQGEKGQCWGCIRSQGEVVEMRLENWQGPNNAAWMCSAREAVIGVFREVRHDLTYIS